MRPLDVVHRDPAPLGRSAAIRSAAELDLATRDLAKRLTGAERLRAGFALCAMAARLRGRAVTCFHAERILAALKADRVDYVAVGGVAVIAHGVVRATVVVDLIPSTEPANLERLAAAIRSLDGVPRGEPGTPVTAALLGRDANMRFDTAAGQLDVLSAEPHRRGYPELKARAVAVERDDGVRIVVVSRNDLIRLKAGTGRDRDLLDIGDLLALDE